MPMPWMDFARGWLGRHISLVKCFVICKVQESGKRNQCGGLPLRAYAFSACLSGAKALLT